ncbi:MAG: YihY/virulence factor BrkB family protein [Pseudorhodobacter sp.]|nr:YihY/virulence factor BrkB family protein [Pseudorhodobacter sp.]
MTKLRAFIAFAQRLLRRIERANLGMVAASVAFFGFLALFPAVAALIALWGFVADPGIIRQQVGLLHDVLPPQAFTLLNTQVESLLLANSRHLGWATLLSTLLALWSARSGVAALVRGLNAIHHLPDRGNARHLLLAIGLTLGLVGTSLAALLAAVVVPVVINFLPLGPTTAAVLELANISLGLLLVVVGLALAYRFGPNRQQRHKPRLLTRGLFTAVVLWALASRGFVLYLANFSSYNQVYGSIGAVVAFLMWLYLSAYAVLLGAAVDADRGEDDRIQRVQPR